MKHINFEDLYRLCNEKNWFTRGSNSQYSDMFDMAKDLEAFTIRDLSMVIWICSEGFSPNDIQSQLEPLVR